jgi:AAA domain
MTIGKINFIHGDADDSTAEMCRAFFDAHPARVAANRLMRIVRTMKAPKLIVITGLPATGKSTLARQLAMRYGIPVIAKDSIKEPLLDVLGAATPEASRKLSDASFAVMFSMARELLAAHMSCVLEGNFRPGEHEGHLQNAVRAMEHHEWPASRGAAAPLDASAAPVNASAGVGTERSGVSARLVHASVGAESQRISIAQVLCRVHEAVRLERLQARSADTTRHPGHRDSLLIEAAARGGDEFLSISGERVLYEGERSIAVLDDWWRR